MSSDLLLNVLSSIAVCMTAGSAFSVLKRIIKKKQKQKELSYDIVKWQKLIYEHQLELEKAKKDLEQINLTFEIDKKEYEELKQQIDNLLKEYKREANI